MTIDERLAEINAREPEPATAEDLAEAFRLEIESAETPDTDSRGGCEPKFL